MESETKTLLALWVALAAITGSEIIATARQTQHIAFDKKGAFVYKGDPPKDRPAPKYLLDLIQVDPKNPKTPEGALLDLGIATLFLSPVVPLIPSRRYKKHDVAVGG